MAESSPESWLVWVSPAQLEWALSEPWLDWAVGLTCALVVVAVGDLVGGAVGESVGEVVGESAGEAVREAVGDSVGEAVGESVGRAVGE